jgi:hypothetical protein
MVCLGNICINTLHKGAKDDDDDNNNSNNVILPCSLLYILISVFSDATPQEIIGSKFIFWQLHNTGHNLRQSQKNSNNNKNKKASNK